MARKFHVEGTKTYLWWAIGLLILSIWFVWDGWFPRQDVLEKHPDPGDSFYAFNKSTGVLLLVAAAICGYIHSVVK